jgi:hypothetical protein
MNRRTLTPILLLAGVVLLTATPMAQALDRAEARRIAETYLSLYPGDDIQNDFRIVHVQPIDLDGDGIEEILYAETATCIGANFDCTNGIRVLALNKSGARPSGYDTMHADGKRAFATGYVPEGNAFIPGDIRRVRIGNATVGVDFEVREDSSICKRYLSTTEGRQPTKHCPRVGKYHWNFVWRHGTGLTRGDQR